MIGSRARLCTHTCGAPTQAHPYACTSAHTFVSWHITVLEGKVQRRESLSPAGNTRKASGRRRHPGTQPGPRPWGLGSRHSRRGCPSRWRNGADKRAGGHWQGASGGEEAGSMLACPKEPICRSPSVRRDQGGSTTPGTRGRAAWHHHSAPTQPPLLNKAGSYPLLQLSHGAVQLGTERRSPREGGVRFLSLVYSSRGKETTGQGVKETCMCVKGTGLAVLEPLLTAAGVHIVAPAPSLL